MKIIKPDFYDTFQCTADKCTFTCCQEWKIAVDEKTEEKWKSYPNPDEKSTMLANAITEKESGRVIRLNQENKCPFLDENKLCKLVMEYGEEILSETCHAFPRQVHYFKLESDAIDTTKHAEDICTADRAEYALVACCPAVIDIWKEREEITWTEDSSDAKGNICFSVRKEMFAIMKNKAYSNEKNLLLLFYMLLDLQEIFARERGENGKERAIEGKSNKEKETVSDKIRKKFQSYKEGDILIRLSERVDQIKFSRKDTFTERNELFLDMIENYRKERLYERYLNKIALLAEYISQETFSEEMNQKDRQLQEKTLGKLSKEMGIPTQEDQREFQKAIQPFETLLRNFLVSEIFTNILIPGGDLESMVVMTQWMAMEYAVMQHAIFLRWFLEGKKKLLYETVRDYMTLCARITGYDQEDIYEYMGNSFESVLWDWGYMALLIGNGKYTD